MYNLRKRPSSLSLHPSSHNFGPFPKAMSVVVNAPELPQMPYFSHSVLTPAYGQTLYLAGQCGMVDGKMIPGTVKDRTWMAIENVKKVLAASNMTLRDGTSQRGRDSERGQVLTRVAVTVVTATVYLSSYEKDFSDMNEAYIEAFKCTGQPVRTLSPACRAMC